MSVIRERLWSRQVERLRVRPAQQDKANRQAQNSFTGARSVLRLVAISPCLCLLSKDPHSSPSVMTFSDGTWPPPSDHQKYSFQMTFCFLVIFALIFEWNVTFWEFISSPLKEALPKENSGVVREVMNFRPSPNGGEVGCHRLHNSHWLSQVPLTLLRAQCQCDRNYHT